MQDLTFLKAICRSAFDGMVIADASGKILLVNPAALKLLGYPAAALRGKPLEILLDPEVISSEHPVNHYPVGKQSVVIGDKNGTRLVKKSGSVFPARMVISRVSGKAPYYAAIIHDLSREQNTKNLRSAVAALEQSREAISLSLVREEESGRTKSRFVALASHEFRTPLSSIQLSASLIEHYFDRLDKDKIFQHLHKIGLAVADMTGTLNDLLSLEKIESGHVNTERRLFCLADQCRDIAEQFRPHLKDGQEFLQDHQAAEAVVYSDYTLLRHCLVNLLSNASKYSPEDAKIGLASGVDEKGYWLQVRDQGLGIPEVEQAGLFEPFFRATNVADIPGTGLGLSIVKKCADLLAGTVTCHSSVDTGTIFRLEFLSQRKNDKHHLSA